MEHGYDQTSPLFAFTAPTIGKTMPTAKRAMSNGIPIKTKNSRPQMKPNTISVIIQLTTMQPC